MQRGKQGARTRHSGMLGVKRKCQPRFKNSFARIRSFEISIPLRRLFQQYRSNSVLQRRHRRSQKVRHKRTHASQQRTSLCPKATGNITMPMITIDGGTLSYDVSGAGAPIVFVAGLGERGTYWTAQVAAFSSAFLSRDLRSWRGGRERRPAALQSRAMGRGHAAAHRSPRCRPGASGRTFDRGYHCASTRSRSLRSCRVPGPRRNLGAARRAIAQAVRFPQASALRAGGF
jgi:hypothetical protein